MMDDPNNPNSSGTTDEIVAASSKPALVDTGSGATGNSGAPVNGLDEQLDDIRLRLDAITTRLDALENRPLGNSDGAGIDAELVNRIIARWFNDDRVAIERDREAASKNG